MMYPSDPAQNDSGLSSDRQAAAEAAAAASPTGAVLMYCRTWCPDCMRARTWLTERNIPFTEVDVDIDGNARDRASGFNEGRLHTPTFEIGDDVCVDFRPDRLSEILGL